MTVQYNLADEKNLEEIFKNFLDAWKTQRDENIKEFKVVNYFIALFKERIEKFKEKNIEEFVTTFLGLITKYPDDFPNIIVMSFSTIIKPFIEKEQYKGMTVKAFLAELQEYSKIMNADFMKLDFQGKRNEVLNKLSEEVVGSEIISEEINFEEIYEMYDSNENVEFQNREILEQDIRKSLDDNFLWKPGVTPATDLRSFLNLLPKDLNNEITIEGQKSLDIFKQYEKGFDKTMNEGFKKYEKVNPFLKMNNASAFLKNAEKEIKLIENNKIITYECSSFSYSAIGYLMLINDDIRKNYDILQIGIMESKGRYLHNIAVLIPKGSEPIMYGELPKGALIVDPWARALGHPANQTLGVSPEDYYFNDVLYPMTINYHSGDEEDLEKTCADFITAFELKTEKTITEFNTVKIFLEENKEKVNEFEEKKVNNFLDFFITFPEEFTAKNINEEFKIVKNFLETFKEKPVKDFLKEFEENNKYVSKLDPNFKQRAANALETLKMHTEEPNTTKIFNKTVNIYIRNGQ